MTATVAADVEPVLDLDLFGQSADQRSIAILREWEPTEGYWLADSFGKDSTVLLDLAKRAGVRFEAHHNLTTIDPPELIRYGRRYHPETVIDRPEKSFWRHVACEPGTRQCLPMRHARWCCEELKERGGYGRRVLTGVRAAESAKRARQTMVQPCSKALGGGKVFVKPLFFWTTEQVWEYIRRRGLPYCELYDQGWERLGCVFCPFERDITRARARWPKLFDGLLRAIRRGWPHKEGYQRIGTPEDVLEWWLDRDRRAEEDDQQMVFDQFGGGE